MAVKRVADVGATAVWLVVVDVGGWLVVWLLWLMMVWSTFLVVWIKEDVVKRVPQHKSFAHTLITQCCE